MSQIDPLQQLEEKAHKEKNNTVKYVLLQELADRFVSEGEYEPAFTAYMEALSIARKMRNSKFERDTLFDLGSTLERLNQIDLAIDCYEKALDIAKILHDFRVQMRISGRLGIILFARTRSTNRAIEYIEQATDAARIEKSEMVIIQEEQTSTGDKSKTLNNNQSSILQSPTDVSNQYKQMEHDRKALRRRAFIVSIPIIIIIFGASGYLIRYSTSDLILPLLIIVFCVIVLICLGIFALYLLG